MTSAAVRFWRILGVLAVVAAALVWLGYVHAAVALGVAALSFVVTPRVESAVAGEGERGSARRAWSALRLEIWLVVACILAVLLWAQR